MRLVALTVSVVILLMAAPAAATDATITGTFVCDETTGEWLVTYSIFNDDPRDFVLSDQDPAIWPDVMPGKTLVFSETVTLPGDALGHSASVIGFWGPEEGMNLVGIVDLREEVCTPTPTTTTTTTTTTPATTTTTDPVETTTTTEPAETTTTAAETTTTTRPQLPFTGPRDDAMRNVAIGAGLLLAGVALLGGSWVVGAWRRR